MSESLQNPIEQNAEKYIHEGVQTRVTPEILSIAERLNQGTFENKINNIFEFLRTLKFEEYEKNNVFRKRTAEQIISDGYVTGCTDDALVFLVLARAMKIPAKYIETLDMTWIRDGGRPIQGHVYVGVWSDEGYEIIDPARRVKGVDIEKDGRIILAEGLDSWDIGAKDFESLAKLSDGFRLTA